MRDTAQELIDDVAMIDMVRQVIGREVEAKRRMDMCEEPLDYEKAMAEWSMAASDSASLIVALRYGYPLRSWFSQDASKRMEVYYRSPAE